MGHERLKHGDFEMICLPALTHRGDLKEVLALFGQLCHRLLVCQGSAASCLLSSTVCRLSTAATEGGLTVSYTRKKRREEAYSL